MLEEVDFGEGDARARDGVAQPILGSLERPGPDGKVSTDEVQVTLALVDAALADELIPQRGREDAAMMFAIHDLEEEFLAEPDLKIGIDRVVQVVADLAAVSQTLDAYESVIARRAAQAEAEAAEVEVKKAFERVAALRAGELQAADCLRMEHFVARRAQLERMLLDQREAEKQTAERQRPNTAPAIHASVSALGSPGARWTSASFTPEQRMLAGLLAYHKVKNGDRPEYQARMLSLRQALGSHATPFDRILARLMATAVREGRGPSDEPSISSVLEWAGPLRNSVTHRFEAALVDKAYETVMGRGKRPALVGPVAGQATQPSYSHRSMRSDGPTDPSR